MHCFVLNYCHCQSTYSFQTCAARACQVLFRRCTNHPVADVLLFPKIYTLIAFYQCIVELWCHATYFSNALRMYFSLYFCKHFCLQVLKAKLSLPPYLTNEARGLIKRVRQRKKHNTTFICNRSQSTHRWNIRYFS